MKYVGRTKDPDRRAKEHSKHPVKSNYKMTVVDTGLTLPQAKVAEQSIISTYTLKYLDNARREIAVGNLDKFRSNMGAVIEIFASIPQNELMGR